MINKKNIFYFFLIFLIFLVDRISKNLIIKLAGNNDNLEIIISKFISLNLIWNRGVAFGLFSFDDNFFYKILTILISIIIIVVLWLIIKSEKVEKYGFIMIFAGSLGNIYDRFVYSSVPDFIDLHYNDFHWFTFNVADIFISLGVILLIFNEINLKKKK